jgi:hypothetical protein
MLVQPAAGTELVVVSAADHIIKSQCRPGSASNPHTHRQQQGTGHACTALRMYKASMHECMGNNSFSCLLVPCRMHMRLSRAHHQSSLPAVPPPPPPPHTHSAQRKRHVCIPSLCQHALCMYKAGMHACVTASGVCWCHTGCTCACQESTISRACQLHPLPPPPTVHSRNGMSASPVPTCSGPSSCSPAPVAAPPHITHLPLLTYCTPLCTRPATQEQPPALLVPHTPWPACTYVMLTSCTPQCTCQAQDQPPALYHAPQPACTYVIRPFAGLVLC